MGPPSVASPASPRGGIARWRGLGLVLGALAAAQTLPAAQGPSRESDPPRGTLTQVWPAPPDTPDADARVLLLEARSETRRPARDGEIMRTGDTLLTRQDGRAMVVLASDGGTVTVGPLSSLRFLEPARGAWFRLLQGALHFLSDRGPMPSTFEAGYVIGGSLGTEYEVRVEGDEVVVALYEGEVILTHPVTGDDGAVHPEVTRLTSGEKAVFAPNQRPRIEPLLVLSEVQWWLYYPSVLATEELRLPDVDRPVLEPALEAYRQGDIAGALEAYGDRLPRSPVEGLFHAALRLAAGDPRALRDLPSDPGFREGVDGPSLDRSLRAALALLAATIGGETRAEARTPGSASEWLAVSYLRQARFDLDGAYRAAQSARSLSPQWGEAALREAELAFSLGRREAANDALRRARDLVPFHPQVAVLEGFLAASEGRSRQALEAFERAIRLDPRLANGFLGRGLMRVREGRRPDLEAGLEDLNMAAALEPNRAELRAYLGKAYQLRHETLLAGKQLRRAADLDPADPTAALYLGLLRQQENRINEGIRLLQESVRLNDHRRVFRSRFLLDEDRGVRGANLALLYRDAGLEQVAVREATRAVEADYANPSAHLFLADSYNALRDPGQADLRYEAPWFTEFLVGNLLSPVGAGSLSPVVSAHEYSRLFDRKRLTIASTTDYASEGAWQQAGAVRGFLGRTDFALESLYLRDPGERPNADFTSLQFSAAAKQQIDADNDVLVRVLAYDYESGDVRRLADPRQANPSLRVQDRREPEAILGYRHTWQAGHHTLVLAAVAEDRFELEDPWYRVPVLGITSSGVIGAPPAQDIASTNAQALAYESRFRMGSVEIQQVANLQESIPSPGRHLLVAGAKIQGGTFDHRYALEDGLSYYLPPLGLGPSPFQTPSTNSADGLSMDRASVYFYDYWDLDRWLSVSLGVAYDHLRYPINHRSPPLQNRHESEDLLAPRIGAMVRPSSNLVLRAAFSQALGGVSFEQSFSLEPTQIAGMNRSFRSLIPESVSGALAAPRMDIAEIALEQDVGDSLFLTLAGAWRASEAASVQGAFRASERAPDALPLETRLDYREWEVRAAAHWLLGQAWSLTADYRLSDASLEEAIPALAPMWTDLGDQDQEARLHDLSLRAWFNSPSGFYAMGETRYLSQSTSGDAAGPGDAFWQFNVLAGYRFLRRQADVRVGLLNLTDQGYHLSPLSLYPRFPQGRTLTVSLRLAF